MSDLAQQVPITDDEPPETLGRNLAAAARLLASAGAFFFLAFLFAYFYLRSLNNGGMWKPKGVEPSDWLGVAVLVGVIACGALVRNSARELAAGKPASAKRSLALALGLGLAGVVVQVIEWFAEGFGPTDGGYASVFIGWTGVFAVFVLTGLVWLEMILATMIRSGGQGADSGAELDALAFFWTFIAGVGAVTFLVLYIV